MIRLATPNDVFPVAENECLIRIHSLTKIYGYDVPFLSLYTDGEGSFLSTMDKVGVFYAHKPPSEEWIAFLQFQEMTHLHTDGETAKQIAKKTSWFATAGVVLRYAGEPSHIDHPLCENPPLPAVYALLADNFPHIAPFEAWYVDYSHRFRHGHCHMAAVMNSTTPVSIATTVAEIGEAAILGQVATHVDYRRRGYAALCLRSLIFRLQGKCLYILPIDDYASKLYQSLGFVPCGTWAELNITSH